MRKMIIAVGVFGAVITFMGMFSGTKISEGQTPTRQNQMLKNSITGYSGIIIMVLAVVGLALDNNNK